MIGCAVSGARHELLNCPFGVDGWLKPKCFLEGIDRRTPILVVDPTNDALERLTQVRLQVARDRQPVIEQLQRPKVAAVGTLAAGHAKGKYITKENAVKGVGIPFHPGAEKFYREVGLIK